MNVRRILLTSTGLFAATAVANGTLRKARVHSARVVSVRTNDGIAYAHVMWTYTSGVQPICVIIDVIGENGATGSLTTNGEIVSGRIPLSTHFSGAYTLTLTATYRMLSIARTAIWTFTGSVASRPSRPGEFF